MQFPTPLIPARLIRRYKRFLADCRLEADGQEVTAHCPNPGSMMGLAKPGTRIWLEPNDDSRRKLRFGWRLVDHENGHFTGVDTALPNRMLKAALEARAVPALSGYAHVRPEVPFGTNSRVDFLLTGGEGQPLVWVEVKSVTLCRSPGLAEFPDAVTERGARHMNELAALARAGQGAIVLFLVQRTDARAVAVARDIDRRYAAALTAAQAAGVRIVAHGTRLGPEGAALGPELPLQLDPAG